MAPKAKAVARPDQTLARREAVTEAFAQLVMTVPEAPDGDIADLLGPILAADTWQGLNQSDEPLSSKTLLGKRLIVQDVARKRSDHESLTGYFLICEAVVTETGEQVRFSAGGEQTMAVLSKLYQLGQLPAEISFVGVATKSGNDAINCKVHEVLPQTIING